jgi:transglutaminase-like putative cysteine protease
MAGWASTAWGTYWGGGDPPGPAALYVWPSASNVIRATFQVPVRAVHRSRFDDALNPANWSITRADGLTPPTILSVVAVPALTPADAPHVPAGAAAVVAAASTQFDIYLSAPMVPGLAYDVQSPGVVGA